MNNQEEKALLKAPKGKFIVIGTAGLNKTVLQSDCSSLEEGVDFAKGIAIGKIPFKSRIVRRLEDLTSIDVVDDVGISQCNFRPTWNTSIDIAIKDLRDSVTGSG